jgi:hypothetical protein
MSLPSDVLCWNWQHVRFVMPYSVKKTDDTYWGIDSDGTCACPICKCQCSAAFTHNAAQIIHTQTRFESHSYEQKKEMNIQKSCSVLSNLMNDATNNAVITAIASGKQFSMQTL